MQAGSGGSDMAGVRSTDFQGVHKFDGLGMRVLRLTIYQPNPKLNNDTLTFANISRLPDVA